MSLTVARLREVFNYDPETGVLTRRITTSSRALAGASVGCIQNMGYLSVNLDGGRYLVHRVIWFYVHGAWPAHQIDHINGVTTDNRLSNLRDVTGSTNQQNRRHATGRTGLMGAYEVDGMPGRYFSAINIDHKQKHLGRFDSAEAAHAAYLAAKRLHHEGCTI